MTPAATYTAVPTPDDHFDFRELAKNPELFRGHPFILVGKVLTIQESANGTVMQLYDAGSVFNSGRIILVIYYHGATPGLYKDMSVVVEGEGAGSMNFQNAFGASITQPVINATTVYYK